MVLISAKHGLFLCICQVVLLSTLIYYMVPWVHARLPPNEILIGLIHRFSRLTVMTDVHKHTAELDMGHFVVTQPDLIQQG